NPGGLIHLDPHGDPEAGPPVRRVFDWFAQLRLAVQVSPAPRPLVVTGITLFAIEPDRPPVYIGSRGEKITGAGTAFF
ncbi:MAG: hypothetical protein AB1405_14485, partial [Bdellovibrionota bacterium]